MKRLVATCAEAPLKRCPTRVKSCPTRATVGRVLRLRGTLRRTAVALAKAVGRAGTLLHSRYTMIAVSRGASRAPFVLCFVAISITVSALALAQDAPTLADIARKTQEQRQRTATRVYTNDDLKTPGLPAPALTPPAAPQVKSDSAVPAATEKPSTAAADTEDGWRARITRARDDLHRNEVFGEALQSRINALTSDFAARDDPAQRAQLADDRQKALEELERVKKDIETSRKAIADIEEQARKAGVPPGWLR